MENGSLLSITATWIHNMFGYQMKFIWVLINNPTLQLDNIMHAQCKEHSDVLVQTANLQIIHHIQFWAMKERIANKVKPPIKGQTTIATHEHWGLKGGLISRQN